MQNGEKIAINVDESYKAVLIIGRNHPYIPNDVRSLYEQSGYLLIGDGKQSIDLLDLSVLKNKVDKNTRIDIWAHGIADHFHSIDGCPTGYFLSKLASYSNGQPMNIHLHACYAGAAASDVDMLPEGSVFVTHSTPDNMTSTRVNSKTILQSNQDLCVTDPVRDFIQRFTLNVKQTATISIKKADGIFQHTIRPPQHMLSDPHKVARYLEHARSEFIQAYDLAFGTTTSHPPEITIEEAIEWRNDNFFSMVAANDKKLLEDLKGRIDDFADCIHNHSVDGKTALMLAIDNKDINLIAVLLALEGVGEDIIRLLSSWNAYESYKTGGITASKLKELDVDKIKFLISYEALYAYQTIGVRASELISAGDGSVLAMTKQLLLLLAKNELTPEQIDGFDNTACNLLISLDAQEAYETERIKASELLGLDKDQIEFLISPDAQQAYKTGGVKASELIDAEGGSVLTMKKQLLLLLAKNGLTLEQVSELDDTICNLLINQDAQTVYRTKWLKVSELLKLDKDQIELLISPKAQAAYSKGLVDTEKLFKLPYAEMAQVLSIMDEKAVLGKFRARVLKKRQERQDEPLILI